MTAPDPAMPPPGAPRGAQSGPPPAAPPPAFAPRADRPAASPPGLVFGILLVVAGSTVLVLRVADVSLGPSAWTLGLIVPGLAMLVASFAIPPRGGLGLAIPGTILAMVGLILYVQNTWDLYGTWAYAWALVAPTAPGLAMLVYGAVRRDGDLAREGLRVTLVGLGLFVGFALFFEGVIGISGHRVEHLDQVLPYASIAFGVLLVVLSLLGDRRRRHA
jgi:hypothetical protein